MKRISRTVDEIQTVESEIGIREYFHHKVFY